MELIGAIFNTFFFAPIVNLLILIFKLLHLVGVPGALGFAIIVLTVGIRFLIWPFTAAQIKSAQKMVSLKPHLDELKKKHQDDKKAFAEAQMALYKEHGVNPTSGCLPTLIQLPVFIALYQAIINVFPQTDGSLAADGLDRINTVLYNSWLSLASAPDPNFFGFNLATKPAEFAHFGTWLLLVPILTGLLTFVQSKMMTPSPPKIYPSDSPKEKKEKVKTEDMMVGIQNQMTYLMPVMIGYFAFQFPVGLAIYWNTFTTMGIIQQYRISGWGGLAGLVGSLIHQKGSQR
ncbi:membrane protein insertase YidC [Candidatus Daviesbacteria bacterium]|nr:membrane protein insertase YidC [Candidatus Daviesbacteria bacterium]